MQREFNGGGEDLSSMLNDQIHGDLNTWDVRMDYARFKHGCVGINPTISYTTNIGMGCGTHTTECTDRFDNDVSKALSVEKVRWLEHIFVDEEIRRKFIITYEHPNVLRRLLRRGLNASGLLSVAQKVKQRLLG